MNLGADLRNAQRRFALAIAAGMITVIALYLLLNRVLRGSWNRGCCPIQTGGRHAIAAFGSAGERIMSVAVFLSAAGF
jgi:hypothetical protein